MVSDLILVVLPLWLLRNTHLDSRLRRRLLGVFALSLFSTAFAIVRGVCSFTVGGILTATLSAAEVRDLDSEPVLLGLLLLS